MSVKKDIFIGFASTAMALASFAQQGAASPKVSEAKVAGATTPLQVLPLHDPAKTPNFNKLKKTEQCIANGIVITTLDDNVRGIFPRMVYDKPVDTTDPDALREIAASDKVSLKKVEHAARRYKRMGFNFGYLTTCVK